MHCISLPFVCIEIICTAPERVDADDHCSFKDIDASIDAAPVMLQFHSLTTKQHETMLVKEEMSLLPAEVHFNGKTIGLEKKCNSFDGQRITDVAK